MTGRVIKGVANPMHHPMPALDNLSLRSSELLDLTTHGMSIEASTSALLISTLLSIKLLMPLCEILLYSGVLIFIYVFPVNNKKPEKNFC